MREWIEMRLDEPKVLRRLPADLGRDLDSPADREMWKRIDPRHVGVRRIDLPRDSPIWDDVLGAFRDAFGDPFPHYSAWLHFRYTKNELLSAEVLRLRVTRAFEPEGEDCGTVYDYSAACPHCGAGRVQTNDLHLKLDRAWQAWPKLPQTRHFQIARTIADEIVVSRVLADRMEAENVTGAQLRPVRGRIPKAQETALWRQLVVTGRAGRTVPPTKFGIDPFKADENDPRVRECRCPLGHVSGHELLSEVHVQRETWDGSDLAETEDMVGIRMGVLVPSPMLLISQRFYRLLLETGTKGFEVTVAHLV